MAERMEAVDQGERGRLVTGKQEGNELIADFALGESGPDVGFGIQQQGE